MALVKLGDKAEGSIVKIKESDVLVDFYIAKQDYEPKLNGSGRVLVVRKEPCDKRQWDDYGHDNDYAHSDIDVWLCDEYKGHFDADIQMAMDVTAFCYSVGNRSNAMATLRRAVFLLSRTEFGFTNNDPYNSGTDIYHTEGTELPVADILRPAYLNGELVPQWTRTPAYSGNSVAWVKGNESNNTNPVSMFVFRPTLTLPADLWVADDGTVTTNTAPTVPSSITVPSQINGGSTVTISWGTATDAEDNLEGYKAERSLDGGTTWSQIYQGSATSATNTVPFGSESVMYRVKAYDAEGLESGWKTSAQVTVINNTAPTVPGSIAVPEAVQGGQPLAVSWGASSDGENNLAGYSLERQVDGGEWAAVYSGPELSFTDQITKGWQTVAYRVRAYDTASAYSGFAASETREVNNNTPPVISCEIAANTNLGVKAEGFAIPYSVADEEGDEVTVTEAVDGAALRTFAVELGAENRLALDGVDFMKLLNGRHTLAITADDGASSTAHSLSFTKEVTAAGVTLAQPMEADGPISVCVLAVSGYIPLDADYRVEVTGNALDDEPVWEDCTAAVRAGVNHVFEHKTAANGFAFNFRLSVERGPSGVGGYITSVQGGFQ